VPYFKAKRCEAVRVVATATWLWPICRIRWEICNSRNHRISKTFL